ncbi:efflux RND transporter periplasmic adaptor subunit [Mucilaginibacter sp. McL0603]|uniref:efflux RND transporter periplasmic adaptor subunit n=1 Tax=Mucilaginibacter sp. McL0603 TaxID=3415670 RepID=UPI003CF31697
MRFKNYALPIAFLFLLGCGSKGEQKVAIEPVNVKVMTMSYNGDAGQQISYSATVKENKEISLTFQVSGNITAMNADKGQWVKKGQLLATLDATTFTEQYNTELARQKLAQDNYNRINDVYKKGSIAEIKLVEAKSNLDQTTSTARAAYQNIVHTKLFAPSDGYIGEKTAEAGDLASPGSSIFKLVKIEQVDVIVPVPELEINNLKKGQPAIVRIAALGDKKFEGKVDEIAVIAEDASHNYNVKVTVNNRDRQLKPGMIANVYFPENGKTKGTDSAKLSIPLSALQVNEQNQNFIYTVDKSSSKSVRRLVNCGPILDDRVTITNGLSAGDQVIIAGYQKITSGTPIKIIQ